MRTTTALILLLALPSCVRFQYARFNINAPIEVRAVDELRPGESRLEDCLQALGAPIKVWEYADGGVALAYGWQDESDWGFHVSWSFEVLVSASFDYSRATQHMYGVVLLLDKDLALLRVRRGLLTSITADLERRRPADPEQADLEQPR